MNETLKVMENRRSCRNFDPEKAVSEAVLSERVIRKLKQKVNINELLILTFTNAAAAEMKDRIRKKIKKDPSLKDQLDYLEQAYITTFDSYALSVVKKYNYLLNNCFCL